jgi:hypothetical protein
VRESGRDAAQLAGGRRPSSAVLPGSAPWTTSNWSSSAVGVSTSKVGSSVLATGSHRHLLPGPVHTNVVALEPRAVLEAGPDDLLRADARHESHEVWIWLRLSTVPTVGSSNTARGPCQYTRGRTHHGNRPFKSAARRR